MISKSDIPEYAPAEIELPNGWKAEIRTEPDEDMGAPWKEHDGHGPVSDWRPAASKRAGERVLCEDRGQACFYDFAEAVRIARRDGWGATELNGRCRVCKGRIDPAAHDAEWNMPTTRWELRHAFTPYSRREIKAYAVERDFERMRAWCNGDWQWIGVIVTVLDAEGEEVDNRSLWGIESATITWREVAADLVNEIAGGVVLPNGAAVRS
jgi:hypothetical protein